MAPIGPEFRKAKRQAVVLADVSARLLLQQLNAEFDAARNHANLARSDIQNAEFGVEAQRSQLRHNQQLAVGVIEETVLHRGVGRVEMNRDAGLHRRVAIAAERDDAVDEVGLLFGERQRIPAQLIRASWELRLNGPLRIRPCGNLFDRADASPRGECDRSRCGDSSRAAR